MRLTTTTMIALAGLLLSGAASAADPQKDKGSTAPAPAGDSNPGGGKADAPLDTRDRVADTVVTKPSNKTWEVGVGAEYHHLTNAGTITDNASSNNILYVGFNASWAPTPYDKVTVRYGFTQGFLIDSGDSSVRSDDIAFTYTRRIPLPGQVTLRPSFSISAPVSYGSQLAGLIISPRVALGVSKGFGKYFNLDGRIAGSMYVMKYAEGGFSYTGGGITETNCVIGCNTGGAVPNSKGSLSLALSADLSMPFHEALGVGLSFFTGYSWYYDVSSGGCPPGTPSTVCMYGTVMEPTTQPPGQRYGAEVNVHYQLPTVGGFKSDAFFAFAPLGDGSLGYRSLLGGTGLQQANAAFYSLTEVYMGVNARY